MSHDSWSIPFTSTVCACNRWLNARSFRLKLNESAMATEKLAEGIASFSQAIVKVEKIIADKIRAASE